MSNRHGYPGAREDRAMNEPKDCEATLITGRGLVHCTREAGHSEMHRRHSIAWTDVPQPSPSVAEPGEAGVPSFEEKLQSLINSESKENESNTPDFILASYLNACLHTFTVAVQWREQWYGRGRSSQGSGEAGGRERNVCCIYHARNPGSAFPCPKWALSQTPAAPPSSIEGCMAPEPDPFLLKKYPPALDGRSYIPLSTPEGIRDAIDRAYQRGQEAGRAEMRERAAAALREEDEEVARLIVLAIPLTADPAPTAPEPYDPSEMSPWSGNTPRAPEPLPHGQEAPAPEKENHMDEHQAGLLRKYDVRRLNDPAGKHTGCTYFVLDLKHDKFAAPAIAAYAAACRDEYPVLAAELVPLCQRSSNEEIRQTNHLSEGPRTSERPAVSREDAGSSPVAGVPLDSVPTTPEREQSVPAGFAWHYQPWHVARVVDQALDALESDATKEQRCAAFEALRDLFYPITAPPIVPEPHACTSRIARCTFCGIGPTVEEAPERDCGCRTKIPGCIPEPLPHGEEGAEDPIRTLTRRYRISTAGGRELGVEEATALITAEVRAAVEASGAAIFRSALARIGSGTCARARHHFPATPCLEVGIPLDQACPRCYAAAVLEGKVTGAD